MLCDFKGYTGQRCTKVIQSATEGCFKVNERFFSRIQFKYNFKENYNQQLSRSFVYSLYLFLNAENAPHICGNEIDRSNDIDDRPIDNDFESENVGRSHHNGGNAEHFYE